MKTCVISCPINTYSGYGARARDLVKSLIEQYPDWDIKILSQRWGQTRQGYLEDHDEQELLDRIVPVVQRKPDVWIQITVPNEFQAVGSFNIGITAGIETTACDSSWIQGCNRMDLVLVSSEHGKATLVKTEYSVKDNLDVLKVTVPVEVLFEGIDTKTYFEKHSGRFSGRQQIHSNWNFLCVGHWLPGKFGEDRKNIGYTIKAFLETFKDCKNSPGLVLKVSGGVASITDQYEILNKIQVIRESVKYKESLPGIYLIHGDLTDDEMNDLYNDPKIKCMISFTKGEGYGRPLAEFATVGKPILCSAWSGHLDFLNKDYTAMVGGTLEHVDKTAAIRGMILEEARWFKPKDEDVVAGLRSLYGKDYSVWLTKAKKQAKILQKEKSFEAMGKKVKELFQKYNLN